MPKKIWRKNFEIKKVDYQLAVEAMESFYDFQPQTVGKYYLKEGIWVNENGDNTGTYFLKNELRGLINSVMNLILNNTDKVFRIHQKTIEYNKRHFDEARKVEDLDLRKLSNKKLISIYNRLFDLLRYSHGYSLYSTWFVDSDGEDLTNHLLSYVKNRIENNKSKINFAEAFSILTTPIKESMQQKEEKESLKILELIKSDSLARKVFLQKNVKKIERDLDKIDKKIKNIIFRHFKKWRWTPYTYVGPAYDLDYYLEIWSSLLRQKINIRKELNRLETAGKKVKRQRLELFKKLKIDRQYRNIFDLAAQIVWLKAYRKDVLFYGTYIADMILKELGKRYNLSFKQMKNVAYYEINKLDKISVDELNQRIKFSVIYIKRGKVKILTGREAKQFLSKQFFEKVTVKDISQLNGTPACAGKVKGVVKVINLPEEMGKMDKGDVMIAHTTFPALVPAMKKASAIVTDDGGLTCHAAIVAREMKTPCVVGTKNATQFLKDGDKVEVDASEGIVRKIID